MVAPVDAAKTTAAMTKLFMSISSVSQKTHIRDSACWPLDGPCGTISRLETDRMEAAAQAVNAPPEACVPVGRIQQLAGYFCGFPAITGQAADQGGRGTSSCPS
jgi:hypothetical protein